MDRERPLATEPTIGFVLVRTPRELGGIGFVLEIVLLTVGFVLLDRVSVVGFDWEDGRQRCLSRRFDDWVRFGEAKNQWSQVRFRFFQFDDRRQCK